MELVYDNSISPGMNLQEGTRGKISLTHWESFNDPDLSFSNIRVDLRHYQSLHREITLAGRLFYGKWFGRDPKSYVLGGVDNWVLNQINEKGSGNPLNPEIGGNRSDLLFTEFITNLRGFDYAEL